MSDTTLKPCPFCGDRPVSVTAFIEDKPSERKTCIRCGSCECQTPWISGTFDDFETALAAWQTRLPDRCDDGCALRKALGAFADSCGP